MKIKVWGARGSVPAPEPETMRYGGNTSCVELMLSDGSRLILDAGTGARNLGLTLPETKRPTHILLTQLHLDHIQGLMFFAPAFQPESEIVMWGPACHEASLRDRVAQYMSAPLAPVSMRELPSTLSFREAEPVEWEIGSAHVRAQSVKHRGPTLGYRIEDAGDSVCYIPDHEPSFGAPLSAMEDESISGFELAKKVSLLIHDGQYTDAEYRDHLGWGHSALSDALVFGKRVGAERLLLFHHDPLHSDDFLDNLASEVTSGWRELGRHPEHVGLARERSEIEIAHH